MSSSAEQATYENGMAELEQIVQALEAGDLGVTETVAKCRRGRALEQALRKHLTECEGQLKEIEQNKNLPEIAIVAAPSDGSEEVPADSSDFIAAGNGGGGGKADDIPF